MSHDGPTLFKGRGQDTAKDPHSEHPRHHQSRQNVFWRSVVGIVFLTGVVEAIDLKAESK